MLKRKLMHNYLVFNGISSEQLGLEVEQIPNANRPARKFDRYSVPGRNGDIIIMQDAWDNVEQSYEIWWGREPGDAVDGGEMIAKWLFGDSGYQTLTDSYDPKHYRKAVFTGPFDVENTLLRYGRATITFDCGPRRFYLSGMTAVEFTASGDILNPSAFTAKPIITVHGSGNGTVEIGGNTLAIAGIYDGMTLDCERQDAYAGNVNLNNLISGSFPAIPGGMQTITITGGITSIEVVPNWWTL